MHAKATITQVADELLPQQVNWITIDSFTPTVEEVNQTNPYQTLQRCHVELGKRLYCHRCREAFPAPGGRPGERWYDGVIESFVAAHASCPPRKSWIERLGDDLARCFTEEDLQAVMNALPARLSTAGEDDARRELYWQHLQRVRGKGSGVGVRESV